MTTTVSISLVSVCAGQEHVRVSASVEGGNAKQFTYGVTELRNPLSWDDAERIVSDLLRLHFRGMTNQQARSALQAGITFVV